MVGNRNEDVGIQDSGEGESVWYGLLEQIG